ncbi:MAG: hypothetical protein LIO37_03860 [Clostridiales bacterium]|nr:hypothetical protein [Clostridiales bacterium]
MIDVHCHIIPGVDDGSDSLNTSIMMAAIAADDGIDTIIATPHFMQGGEGSFVRYMALQQAAAKVQHQFNESGIPVNIRCGAEVLCTDEVMHLLETGEFPRIVGTDYSLVEFDFDEPIAYMNHCLHQIRRSGIRVIVAHPERYFAVQANRKVLKDWVKWGYCLQVNKGSFQGQFGKAALRTANWIMKNKLAVLLASDAHNTTSRNPRLSHVRHDLSRKYGDDMLSLLTEVNPERLLLNKPLLLMDSDV